MRWSSLRRALDGFGDKTFFVYLWVVPLFATIGEAVSSWLGHHVELPHGLFWSFMTAVLYYFAYLSYRFWCPPAHKDIKDLSDALERDAQYHEKVLKVLQLREQMLEAAKKLTEDVIENRWSSKEAFTAEEQAKLKPLLLRRYLNDIDSLRNVTQALAEPTKRGFDTLDRSAPIARFLASVFLTLSVSGTAVDAGSNVLRLFNAT